MTLTCNLDSNSSGIRGDASYECYESSEHGYLLSYIIARIANWLLFFIFKSMLCLIFVNHELTCFSSINQELTISLRH